MAASEKETKFIPSEIDILGMLQRRWRHLAFGCVAGIVLSVIYWQTVNHLYESSIEVLVGQRSSEATNRGTITEGTTGNDSVDADQLATHMRLFVAKKVLAKAIATARLEELESFKEAKADGIPLIDHMIENIEVERGGDGAAENAMVLRARFWSNNPEDASIALSAIFNSYKSYVETQGQDSSEQAVELIKEAQKSHERELLEADEAYRKFVQSVPVLLDGDKVRDIHKERLADMETELNTVRSKLSESTSRLQVIESSIQDNESTESTDFDYLALLSENEVDRLKFFLDMTRGGSQSEAFQAEQPLRAEEAKAQYNRMLDLIQKERALGEAFGPGHPMVTAVRNEIDITKSFIDQNRTVSARPQSKKLEPAEMLATYRRLLQNDIAELEKRQEFLVVESEQELIQAKQVESDFMMGNSLRARVQRAQARYDQVFLRLQELNLAKSYAGFSTDVLASPEAPLNPIWPNAPIILALGCGAGLALGLALALLAETMDSTFRSVKDLESAIGAPVIAHMPRLSINQLRRDTNPESPLDPTLVAYHAPQSPEAEIYRVARTSLMISNRKGSVRTMMMTSAQPGDGKSTTVSNLAISFAQTGKRVLLIDADMRRPMISTLFGLDVRAGLSDYLSGQTDLSDNVVSSAVAGLDLMPSGRLTGEPAELLESPRIRTLIHKASAEYDLVLIDAPPLLAVADPAIIAPSVDAVILTVRVIKNGRFAVQDAARVLEDIQVEPTAVLVNGVDRQVQSAYAYGGYRGNQYGYVGHYSERYSAQTPSPEVSSVAERFRMDRDSNSQLVTDRPRGESAAPMPKIPLVTSNHSSSMSAIER